MKSKTIIIILSVVLFSFCSNDRFSLMENHNYQLKINRKLGTYAQKQNLWREAIFRWRKVIKLNPKDFEAHNNLAVAYEAVGDYAKAEKEYKIALSLDNNEYVRRNYESFKAILKNLKNKRMVRGKHGKFKRKI